MPQSAPAAAVRSAAWPAGAVSAFEPKIDPDRSTIRVGEHDGVPGPARQSDRRPADSRTAAAHRPRPRPLPDRGRRDRAARGQPPRARPRPPRGGGGEGARGRKLEAGDGAGPDPHALEGHCPAEARTHVPDPDGPPGTAAHPAR